MPLIFSENQIELNDYLGFMITFNMLLKFWLCAGKVEECRTFFWTLYKFIYLLGTYLKPHVSVQPFQVYAVKFSDIFIRNIYVF